MKSYGRVVLAVVAGVVLWGLAGWVAAALAGERARVAVIALAVVNLAIGVAVELSYWEMSPVWYHVVFLVLIVPATLYGGRVREGHGAAGRWTAVRTG